MDRRATSDAASARWSHAHAGGIDQPVGLVRMKYYGTSDNEAIPVILHTNWRGTFDRGTNPKGVEITGCGDPSTLRGYRDELPPRLLASNLGCDCHMRRPLLEHSVETKANVGESVMRMACGISIALAFAVSRVLSGQALTAVEQLGAVRQVSLQIVAVDSTLLDFGVRAEALEQLVVRELRTSGLRVVPRGQRQVTLMVEARAPSFITPTRDYAFYIRILLQ